MATRLEKRLKFIASRAESFSGMEEQVGWFPDARYDDGTPVAMVANIQEHGAPAVGIPPRKPISTAKANHVKDWGTAMKQGVKAALAGRFKPEQILTQIGQKAAGDMRVTIAAGGFERLSDTTLRLRKMVDDGMRREDITRGTVALARQEAAEGAELSGRTQPLTDTGYMISTLTSVTVKTKP